MPLSLHSDEPLPDGQDYPGRREDRHWLEQIQAGNEAAFASLFREHYHGLCVYAARLVRSDALAEELVQDVFLRIWQQRERLEVTGTLAAYLYGATRNQALGHLRHERVEQRWRERSDARRPPTGASSLGQADEATRAAELAAAIERAVAALPPRCREAFLLRRQHHLSYTEIARVMSIAPKTVEIQIGAALKALRKSLADWLAP